MKQKIFLTSALAMGFVAPAFAEPSHTGTFPSGGLMQEDYTYTNAATSTNMDGVYSGTVNAVAEYDIIDYIVNAGQYLPADSETVITCPAGSYCPGISGNVQYNQTTAQGIQTCPSGYASSAAGASSNTQCYRACDINNMGANGSISSIAHATAISGNDYYGNGTDTCEPTSCENGWHVKAAVTAPNLTSLIGSEAGTGSGYISNDGNSTNNESTYGITQNGEFVVDYGAKGKIHGHAQCSTQSGQGAWKWETNSAQNPTIASSLADETGQEGAQYCYCNVTGYTPDGGTMQSVSSSWVFVRNSSGASGCASSCASSCVNDMRYTYSDTLAFRAAVFGTIESSLAMCEANVININWNDVDPATAGQNNEGTAVYGEDVRTPFKAQTKKGKTFRGWRFSKPETTNLPE